MANKKLEMVEDWLLAIGGVNWGLTLFGVNLVTMLGEGIGQTTPVNVIVYGAVGLSALHKIAKMTNLMK